MRKFIALAALALAACQHDTSTVESVSTVYVKVPAPCPAKEEREKLIRERPVQLRNQPMPATPVERVAQSQAQLGKYEADGGWGDKVIAAFTRCGKD